jgi:hypothetical protein
LYFRDGGTITNALSVSAGFDFIKDNIEDDFELCDFDADVTGDAASSTGMEE